MTGSPLVETKYRTDVRLLSGGFFDYLAPESSLITIDDIAAGLSNESRYNGQTGRDHAGHGRIGLFYSVAQHSTLVSLIVPPKYALHGLLHDCAECVMKDVPKPLKRLLPDYQRLEKIVECAILAKFGITLPLHPSVKLADLILLATEKRDLTPLDEDDGECSGVTPLAEVIVPMPPAEAKAAFLARYYELTQKVAA